MAVDSADEIDEILPTPINKVLVESDENIKADEEEIVRDSIIEDIDFDKIISISI